jgi:cell division septum initiation protein DivIVA
MAEREKERAPVDGAELIEKYITELGPIPERLHRNFRLIRDLDERSAQLQAQVDEKCRQQMEALQGKGGQAKRARHSPEDQALSREIQAMQQQIINMAEEKVSSLASTATAYCHTWQCVCSSCNVTACRRARWFRTACNSLRIHQRKALPVLACACWKQQLPVATAQGSAQVLHRVCRMGAILFCV